MELSEITLQDNYIVFFTNQTTFFPRILSLDFFFLLIMPSYIAAAFLSLDFCQLDLSSLLGPTVLVMNHFAFQKLPYFHSLPLTLLKVAEGQSEPQVLDTKSRSIRLKYFTISICKK